LTRVVVNLLYEVAAGDPLTYACFKPNHYPEASFSPRPTLSWMWRREKSNPERAAQTLRPRRAWWLC
jgi:hypothetical protein